MKNALHKNGCANAIQIFAFLIILSVLPQYALASQTDGTIDATLKYAWSNNAGWVNFAPTNGNVHVTDSAVTGYIWDSRFGSINLAPTQGGVTNNGEGILGGNAWSTGVGWISFSGVSIDANGLFHGQASGTGFGILTFDCTNCAVKTDWRPASVRTPVPTPAPTTGGGGGGGIPSLIGVPQTQNNPSSVLPPPAADAAPVPDANITQSDSSRASSAVAAAAAPLTQATNLFDVQVAPAGSATNQNWLWWAILSVILVLSGMAGYALWWFILVWRRRKSQESNVPQELASQENAIPEK